MYKTKPPRSASKFRAAAREQLAVELRKGGATMAKIGAAIAEQEGLSKPITAATVSRILKRALARLRKYTDAEAEDLRQLELERIDDLIAGLWEAAKGGHPDSVKQFLAVQDRRCKLLGIEPPQRHVHDINVMSWAQVVQSADARIEEKQRPIVESRVPLGLLTDKEDDG
ncbi:MAG: hypothetical protein AMJ46_12560 [Latescibacteria bacterium DG_63]|nr:MAG: hypothetical protein AMJ46_12560 [Latescibacteria bacterium DG_63]